MALACLAAMLFTASTVSANPPAETKTRVWDFSSAAPLNVWLERSASPRTHLENQSGSLELTSVSPHAARAGSELVKVGKWTLDPKVSRHLTDVSKSGELVRPYLKSPHTLEQIMKAGKPVADPRGFPGAVRYDVPGAFRGSEGTWELVVHPESKTVLHWLFRSGP